MESSDTSFMMSFLKDFDYPLIHSMNYEEMSNVFHISNRCFLICWALKLLDEDCYLEVLKDREQDKDLLGNLISQHGFCTGKEKIGFFNGDLSVANQVQILHRLFKFIKRLKKEASIDHHVPVTLENLHTLMNTNLNIFPIFGEMKTLSEKEKILQINKLEKEIEGLKVVSENSLLEEQTNIKDVCQINKTDLRNILEKVNENFYQFDRTIKAISKEKSYEIKSNYKVDTRSEELFGKCNSYLRVVSQYIEDLKTINSFGIMDLQEPDDEISPLIQILAEQINNSYRSI